MSEDKLPVRGDPNRMADICNTVGSSPVPRDNIVDGYEESKSTINNEIRYALRLGFLEEVEDEVVATEAGLELASTYEGEERRAECFRRSIARHEGYRLLVNKLFRKPEIETVERRDVQKIIRVNLGDMGDDTRRRAATLFLDTIEAAGIGTSKNAYKQKPARIEIEDQDALQELLATIDGENPSSSSESNETQPAPEGTERRSSDVDVEKGQEEGQSLKVNTSISESPSTNRGVLAPEHTDSAYANFEISLELDGTEDPSHIELLVAAVQRGLHTNPQGQPDSQTSPKSTKQKTEHPTDSTSADNIDTTSATIDGADSNGDPNEPSPPSDSEESENTVPSSCNDAESPESSAPSSTDQGTSDESTPSDRTDTVSNQDEEPERDTDRESEPKAESNDKATSEESDSRSNLDDFS